MPRRLSAPLSGEAGLPRVVAVLAADEEGGPPLTRPCKILSGDSSLPDRMREPGRPCRPVMLADGGGGGGAVDVMTGGGTGFAFIVMLLLRWLGLVLLCGETFSWLLLLR